MYIYIHVHVCVKRCTFVLNCPSKERNRRKKQMRQNTDQKI